MPKTPEQFIQSLVEKVRSHYESATTPLLLSQLGAWITESDGWPENREGRGLRQLIEEYASPDLEVIRDEASPAYIAVVPLELRGSVEAQIRERHSDEHTDVPLTELARPVLLAFCVRTPRTDDAVYLHLGHPFRYEIVHAGEPAPRGLVLIEPEYRLPGLMVGHIDQLAPSKRHELARRIRSWSERHGLNLKDYSTVRPGGRRGDSALDRLLSVQLPGIAEKLLIPADIAQLLARN